MNIYKHTEAEIYVLTVLHALDPEDLRAGRDVVGGDAQTGISAGCGKS